MKSGENPTKHLVKHVLKKTEKIYIPDKKKRKCETCFPKSCKIIKVMVAINYCVTYTKSCNGNSFCVQ